MTSIVNRGIFQKINGYWWGNSPIKEGYEYSLHTRDKAEAQARYDDQLARLRQGEADLAEYDAGLSGQGQP